MTPEAFVHNLGRHRTTAIIRTSDSELAAAAMAAAIAGGIRFVEFGAGTVLDAAQVERAVEAGASFHVSPVFDPAIVRAASEAGS